MLPPATKAAIPRSRAVTMVVALSVSLFALTTVEDLPVGLLPSIADDLHVSLSAAGFLVTGYGITVAVASVPLTQLTRRIPRRYLLSGVLVCFTTGTLLSVVAQRYWVLLLARVSIALAHAIFWSIVAATAAGLFPPESRGRVVAGLFTGVSLATVLGVPAGTWLGQQTNWRFPFLIMAGFSAAALAVIAAFLPTAPPRTGQAATGSQPSARRFWSVIVTVGLASAGMFTAYTYISVYLADAAGFSESAVGPLLLVAGVAGIAGTNGAGALVDRHPWAVMVTSIALMAVALFGLYFCHANRWAVGTMVALVGFSIAGYTTTLQNRILMVAPGSTDIASAIGSATFNVGIAGGGLLGGQLLARQGILSVTLIGGVVVSAALAVLLVEPLIASRRTGAGEASGDGPSERRTTVAAT